MDSDLSRKIKSSREWNLMLRSWGSRNILPVSGFWPCCWLLRNLRQLLNLYLSFLTYKHGILIVSIFIGCCKVKVNAWKVLRITSLSMLNIYYYLFLHQVSKYLLSYHLIFVNMYFFMCSLLFLIMKSFNHIQK